MWAYEGVFYQIYPLGFCGAPFENDGTQQAPETAGIRKVIDCDWTYQKAGGKCQVYSFSPVRIRYPWIQYKGFQEGGPPPWHE